LAQSILLTGATGYVGGRLLPLLHAKGFRVRCIARRPEYLAERIPQGVEVVQADLMEPDSLPPAMAGCDQAVYLVHSMGSRGDFASLDLQAAQNFANAAAQCGLRRIVYLGGLADDSERLSAHLRSRLDVGQVLRSSGIPVTELRASVIIGSGSLSFEMVRALVERLPVLITPRWVRVPSQPIAIEDVLAYLIGALRQPPGGSKVYEIGGADVVTYGDLMREYARQRGLKRWMIPVPVLTPGLSSLWLGLVTPLFARVGRKLIDSIRHPTVVREKSALSDFRIQPMGMRDAIARALRCEDSELAATRWSDAVSASYTGRQWGGRRYGNRLVDVRASATSASPEAAFRTIQRIGGRNGWYYAPWLWRIRGWLDLLIGGVGMRRGRRDPERLAVGDVLDCWRVEALEHGKLLRLAAEMKLPGRAWLEFSVRQDGGGQTEINQVAMFDPLGLAGILYWYAIWPLHELVFAGMLRAIVRNAEASHAACSS
jgi:uncharacterized protein YbjT (DUF2867 family)